MSKFCFYNATGYIYSRDKDGNIRKGDLIGTIKAKGCAQYNNEMYGSILRQSPDLRKCDRVDFETWGI